VYLDARSGATGVCGQGGGSFLGSGTAVVYLYGCDDVATAPSAVHELLHAMGAVPSPGPPNACPDNVAHVCDSTGDVMSPFAEYAQLPALGLDVGNNDYYAHADTWTDIQDSAWLRRVDAPTAVTVQVTGTGTVSSLEPGYASCAAACTVTWDPGASITLQATPAAGMRFVRWSGRCVGTTSTCSTDASQAGTVDAVFGPATFHLAIRTSGSGRVVASTPSFGCAGSCTKTLTSFAPVLLTAKPAKGWRLTGWSGNCHGTKSTCLVPMGADAQARAIFARR
jgi:hypothetical protein